jgi:hypothetical protein
VSGRMVSRPDEPGGGPAFPTVGRDGNWQPHVDGMTLRDYFAGQALAGLIMRDAVIDTITAGKKAYAFADDLLAARGES